MSTKTETTGQANDLAQLQHQPDGLAKWAASIDDKRVSSPHRKVTAKVLMNQANLPTDHVLVRDLGGEHDVALSPAELVDLALGNVFYSVPQCEAPQLAGHHAPPKLALFVDDRPEETMRADLTGRTLRELFGFTPEVLLFRDYESPNDKLIGLDDPVNFGDGPVFYTRRRHSHTVTITINGKAFELHQDKAPVAELKKLAGIPLADVLVRIENGQMVPLADNAVVELHCGDVFVSHPRDNASS